MAKFLIQPHVRLHEWVAEENGFFRDEGLDYEFDAHGFAAASITTSSVKPADAAPVQARSGAFEDMEKGRSCDVSGACHWAVNAAASTSHGRMWGKAYSICTSGIYVAPESGYQRPEDLAGVEVGVGYHSGSHYSAIQGLEPFLDPDEIRLSFVGFPFDRVRLMRDRRIPAANVWGAQLYLLEQWGFRKLVDTTFMMGFLVSADAEPDDLERYFRGLRRAQAELDLEPEPYKRHWLNEMPEDLAAAADVRRFGPGERIVFEPYTREMFDRTHRWMERWQLFDSPAGERSSYEQAVLT
jgi:ABC-type nitrate/sulfonate/bicarbonate transport system substrate-binding protein